MGISIARGSFDKSSGTGNVSYTGVGFRPEALIIFSCHRSGEGFASEFELSIGVSDGTDDYCICGVAQDQNPNSNTGRGHRAAVCFGISTGLILRFSATVNSFDTDGFTLNWATAPVSTHRFYYIALGGLDGAKVDIFAPPFAAGSQSITGTGFQADAIIFLHAIMTSDPPQALGSMDVSVGMATGSAEEAAMTLWSTDNIGVSDTTRGQKTDKCIIFASTAIFGEADFTSFDADGFTINWSSSPGTTYRVGYIALKKADSFFVGNETQGTSTGDRATTGVGFYPAGLLTVGFNRTATASLADDARLSFGVATVDGEASVWAGDADAKTMMEADQYRDSSTLLTHVDTDSPSSVDAEANLKTFDLDGFTLDWTTADAVARQFFFMAFEGVGKWTPAWHPANMLPPATPPEVVAY